MKVFSFYWSEDGYGAGLMFVAANNKQEAIIIATTKNVNWVFKREINELTYNGEKGIIDFAYYQE